MKAWESKRPENLALFTEVRQAIDELSEELTIPAQNLITTDYVRRLCWEPPARVDEQTLRDALAEYGARSWQTGLVAPVIAPIFARHLG